MNIRHLKIFQAVCEEGSLTKAAETLHITQPAISNTIAELEADIGTRLFDRISRKVQLNETGKRFLAKANTLLALYDDLASGAKRLEEGATIKIGSSISNGGYVLPEVMERFGQVRSGTPTTVVVENARTIEGMVARNQVDIGLVEGIVEDKNLVDIRLSPYELVIVCAARHPFAKRESVDIHELTQEKFLLREKGSAIRDVFDSALMLYGLKVEPVWTSVNSEVLLGAVRHNLGISVLPRRKVERALRAGELREIEVNDLTISNDNHIIFQQGKYQTEAFKTLVQVIQSVAQAHAPQSAKRA